MSGSGKGAKDCESDRWGSGDDKAVDEVEVTAVDSVGAECGLVSESSASSKRSKKGSRDICGSRGNGGLNAGAMEKVEAETSGWPGIGTISSVSGVFETIGMDVARVAGDALNCLLLCAEVGDGASFLLEAGARSQC